MMVDEADNNMSPEYNHCVADALIKSKKIFDFLLIPGPNYTSGGDYGKMKRLDFFVQHLLGVLPPEHNSNELSQQAK